MRLSPALEEGFFSHAHAKLELCILNCRENDLQEEEEVGGRVGAVFCLFDEFQHVSQASFFTQPVYNLYIVYSRMTVSICFLNLADHSHFGKSPTPQSFLEA